MLPVIPFRFLGPLAIGIAAATLGVIALMLVRRLALEWYSRNGERQIEEVTRLLEDAFKHGGAAEDRARNWLRGGRFGRISAFQTAALRLIEKNEDFATWLRETGFAEPLAELVRPSEDDGGILQALHLTRSRWARVVAAETLGLLQMNEALEALGEAVTDPDGEVAYAAASALARNDDPWAASVILNGIGRHAEINDARLAALIESMSCDMTDLFRDMLRKEDSKARFWALTLIGRKLVYELVEDVRPLLDSKDANVRAAATEAVGELAVPLTDYWLTDRLADEAWFVRSHAAHSLGKMEAQWAAEPLVEMLNSTQWWVRSNCIDALVALGQEAWEPTEEVLFSDDKFARNSAVEVLARTGWTEMTAERASKGNQTAYRYLVSFGMSGGLGYLENALFTVSHEAVPVLLEILQEIGDDASYGRIRAAREEYPEDLEEKALAVASTLRGD